MSSRSSIPAFVAVGIACGLFTLSALAAEPSALRPVPDFFQMPAGWTLGNCSAVAANKKGEIFVFHRGEHPVLVFDSAGKFLRSWGDGVIEMAHGLRIDRDENVWVTDIAVHRVFKFDPTGKELLALGTGRPGDGNDEFNKPTDVAFGPDGEFYVTDGYGNSRVVKFSPSGAFIKTWGAAGKGRSQFNLPHAIVMDGEGRLLVGDRENSRIQIFNRDGRWLDAWGGFAPYGMALASDGTLFVADGKANCVVHLDAKGKVKEKWGKKGAAPGEFDLPHMLTFDPAGSLYVAEVNGKRVQKFLLP